MNRRICVWALMLMLLSAVSFARAEEEPPAEEEIGGSLAMMHDVAALSACELEVREAYAAVLKQAHRKDFKGYCAMYANQLLVYYGINREYIKGDANKLYGIYSRMTETDGGYEIRLYPARQYRLEGGLNAVASESELPRHILAVFSRGVTEKGKEFGHVVYINAIIGGRVIYSESAPAKMKDTVVDCGEPIVCTIAEFAARYRNYKCEGVIWFVPKEEPEAVPFLQEPSFVNQPPSSFRG